MKLLIGNMLCKLGIHSWIKHVWNFETVDRPRWFEEYRKCRRCKKEIKTITKE